MLFLNTIKHLQKMVKELKGKSKNNRFDLEFSWHDCRTAGRRTHLCFGGMADVFLLSSPRVFFDGDTRSRFIRIWII